MLFVLSGRRGSSSHPMLVCRWSWKRLFGGWQSVLGENLDTYEGSSVLGMFESVVADLTVSVEAMRDGFCFRWLLASVFP